MERVSNGSRTRPWIWCEECRREMIRYGDGIWVCPNCGKKVKVGLTFFY